MCERRMWGEADGLRCVDESGGEHTHRYEASAGPDNDSGHRHADQEATR